MTTDYEIEVIHEGSDARLADLRSAVSDEVLATGVHSSVTVSVITSPPSAARACSVLLGSTAAAVSPECEAATQSAVAADRTIIPVVDFLRDFAAVTPPAAHALNGWEWSGTDAARRLARVVLEDLGVEERQRRVFISHKRDDGLLMAEQLHDALVRNGFQPFIDRFAIRAGAPVQEVIADALEDYAFLLLLESPLAHTSRWVYDEVEYALSRYMGIHIITFPSTSAAVPGTPGLARRLLAPRQLLGDPACPTLDDATLDAVLAEVESIHARGLVRRRTNLLAAAADAARRAGHSAIPLPNWRLLVETTTGARYVVGVTGRLPQVEDLYRLDLDRARLHPEKRVLVHAARAISPERSQLIRWIVGRRQIDLIPEYAIGGYW